MSMVRGLLLVMCLLPWVSVNAAVEQDLGSAATGDEFELEGAVIRGESDEYTFAADAGLLLTVNVSASEDNAVFQVYGEVEGSWTPLIGADEGDDATNWQDNLPAGGSGLFKVVVGPTRGNAEYVLNLSFE